MDGNLFITTFMAIFLAELGDKTQLATLSLATGATSRVTVFLASALALITTSALAVLGGDLLAQWISPIWVQRAAGSLFVAMGIVFLVRSF
jgi:putative Ca2+/H+ antiporter (TMEM165/GDT1 family)